MTTMDPVSRAATPLQAHTSVAFPPPADGFAHILVSDNLNAPRFEKGDVLLADLSRTEWRYDGIYVLDLHGQQVVRYVQDRGSKGLYVYYLAAMDLGQFIPKSELRVLAAIKAVNCTRRVA
ncbi:hypothetical protein GIW57_05355 [Stenotrophomonas sp. PA-6-5C]|uniref:S24 family peptidase n=1 Tax=Stenotrophomonas sp. PA-6-5C TaxID=2665487 RepID=UPI001F28A845|nr:hypothetical protein [Stenotrophomonas sp. PA-6-5C]MCF5089603.1 hypothetical protein [Stenotrophomonas sp. PA-6-5C]